MENQVKSRSKVIRRIFWLMWPALTLVGLLLIGQRALVLLRAEGQFVNLIRPTGAIALTGDMQLGQTFVAPHNGLERIDVLLYGYRRRNTQPVTFHLQEVNAGQDTASITFNAREVWGWRWKSFDFQPVADSAGKLYYFFLESSTSTPDDSLSMGGVEGDLYPHGTAFVQGFPIFADAAFLTFYSDISSQGGLSVLSSRITQYKPSIWGDIGLYIGLGVLYLLLMIGLGGMIYYLGESEVKTALPPEVQS